MAMSSKKEIAARLSSFCKAEGITLNEVSEKTGIHLSTLYGLGDEKTAPRFLTLLSIVDAFPGLSFRYLLLGEEPVLERMGLDEPDYLHAEYEKIMGVLPTLSARRKADILPVVESLVKHYIQLVEQETHYLKTLPTD